MRTSILSAVGLSAASVVAAAAVVPGVADSVVTAAGKQTANLTQAINDFRSRLAPQDPAYTRINSNIQWMDCAVELTPVCDRHRDEEVRSFVFRTDGDDLAGDIEGRIEIIIEELHDKLQHLDALKELDIEILGDDGENVFVLSPDHAGRTFEWRTGDKREVIVAPHAGHDEEIIILRGGPHADGKVAPQGKHGFRWESDSGEVVEFDFDMDFDFEFGGEDAPHGRFIIKQFGGDAPHGAHRLHRAPNSGKAKGGKGFRFFTAPKAPAAGGSCCKSSCCGGKASKQSSKRGKILLREHTDRLHGHRDRIHKHGKKLHEHMRHLHKRLKQDRGLHENHFKHRKHSDALAPTPALPRSLGAVQTAADLYEGSLQEQAVQAIATELRSQLTYELSALSRTLDSEQAELLADIADSAARKAVADANFRVEDDQILLGEWIASNRAELQKKLTDVVTRRVRIEGEGGAAAISEAVRQTLDDLSSLEVSLSDATRAHHERMLEAAENVRKLAPETPRREFPKFRKTKDGGVREFPA